MTLEVGRDELVSAAADWDRQETLLDTARQRLRAVDPAELGRRVAPHLAAFLATWETETAGLHASAAGHASALRGTSTTCAGADSATVRVLHRLLPWPDRGVTPWAR